MAHAPSYAPWPGRSAAAWAEAEDAYTASWSWLWQCWNAPDIETLEDFRRDVRIPFPEGCLLCAVLGGLAALPLALHAIGPDSVQIQNPTWSIAIRLALVLTLVIALVGYVRGTRALPFASRRAHDRMRTRPHLIGRVYPARSTTGTEVFCVEVGDVLQDTAVVIDTAVAADDAARLLRAFDVWFTVLESDYLARRGAQLRFGSATIVTSEEIFGPGAVGGYLVRDQHPGTSGWRLLIADRSRHPVLSPYRRGEVLTVADSAATATSQSRFLPHTDRSDHLLGMLATGVVLCAAAAGWLWFGWTLTSGPW